MNIIEKYTGRCIFSISLLLFLSMQLVSTNPGEQDRFFAFALDMFQRGPSFFPYVHNAPYPDYIALVMILGDMVAHLFGHVSLFSVGLPYCIAGALLVTFTYLLGATQNKQLGVMAAYFCFLSWKFLDAMSALDLDLFPALATVICIYLAHKKTIAQEKPPYLLFCILWLFAYFCRGPIGLLIPAMITGLYYFSDRHLKISAIIAILSVSLFSVAWATLLFMAYHTGGSEFFYSVLEQEGAGRLINEHAARYYFFFTIGLLDYAFTSIFALMVGARYLKQIFSSCLNQPNKKLLLFSLQWILTLILFFTIPATKKARYIMACVPAFALLSAHAWILDELQPIKKVILLILKSLPWLGILIAGIYLSLPHIETAAHYLLLISIACIISQYLFKQSRYQVMSIYLLALIQMIAIHLTIIEPLTLHSLSRPYLVPWF